MGARLAWQNLLTASGVVITSSSEATGHADDNLSHAARWKDWRAATGTSDGWVKFDLGSNRTLQVLAAMDVTIPSGWTFKIQANTTDAWVTPVVNVTATVPSPNYTGVVSTWLSGPQSLRWVRFFFQSSGASGTPEIGAVFAGSYLEPSRSLGASLSVRRMDPSVQRYAIGGQRSAVTRSKFHQVSGTFVLQTTAAREALRTAYETIGATVPAILAVDPADTSLVFYGALQSTLSAEHRGADLWDIPIEFTEDVP